MCHNRLVVPDTTPADDADPRAIGRFTVMGRLGVGAMGVVFAAYDPQLDRKVAVKLLKPDDDDPDGRWQHRLLREAQALAKLSHPNVVQIHEVGFHGDQVFVAMEFVTGVTVRTWLSEQPRPWREVVAVFAQAGRGLAAAHAAGLVHRDIKPDNFLVGADGRVRVVDFGLVRFDDDDADAAARTAELLQRAALASPTRTAPGMLVGTPAYMSPEQYRGRPADAQSDQFSFCVALFEALYGERPFAGATAQEVSRSVLSGQIAARPDRHVPAWLGRAVLRGLHGDPKARWPDMNALVGELARDHDRARRALAWLGAGLVAAAAVLVAGLGINSCRADRARERAEQLASQRLAAAEATIDPLLEGGRKAEAAAVFDAFTAVPEHRGTRALTRAWRGWGERLRRAGDLDVARAAIAQAYASAGDPASEREILGELARLFDEQWSYDQLAAVCAVLEREPDAAAAESAARCAAAAFARRDLAGAEPGLRASPDLADMSPIAAAWAGATATDRLADAAGLVDVDGDGVRELYLYTTTPPPGRLDVVRADASLTPLHRYPLASRLADRPGVDPLSYRPGEPALLFTWSQTHRRVSLSTAAPDRLVEQFTLPADEPLAAAAADLDRDGAPEIYLGTGPYGRQLLALRRLANGTWHPSQPHPDTDATNSDINAIVAADLDDDGQDELAVAAGAWRAFDVRVLRPAAGDGDGAPPLELVARRKLGDVSALAVLRAASGERLLVAAKTDAYPSKVAFSPQHPAGPPAGLYFLRLRGGALDIARFLPAPRRSGDPRPVDLAELLVGDIDGDGLDDLVARAGEPRPAPPLTLVYRQRRDGTFASARIAGLVPLALADLDGDPARELLARAAGPGEATLWILGAGDSPLPPLPSAHATVVEPPPGLTDPLALRAWRRAEQLAALGLSSEAARAHDDLAALLVDSPARAAARLRAAELHEAAADYLTAAERFEAVADTAGTAALQGAARCYEQSGRFADALRVTRVLAVQSDLPRAEAERLRARLLQLAAIVEDVEVTPLRFDQPLRAPWRIDDPTSVRQDLASRRLQIDAFAGEQPIARLPFEWSTGPLGVRIDLSVQRAEWGSGLLVGLRPLADPGLLYAVGLEVLGGGGLYERRHLCHLPGGGRDPDVLAVEPGDDPARPGAASLSLELLPELGLALCTAELAGVRHQRRLPLPVDALPPPGRYELVVLPSSFTEPSSLWLSAQIDAITVRGALRTDDPGDEDPRALAARLLAHGEAESALAALDRLEAPDPLLPIWRALALSELGRWPEASEALRPAAGGEALAEPARQTLRRLLRTRPQSIAPLVRSAFGPGYFRLFWESLERTVQHHGDPLVERTLTTALSDLADFSPDPAATEDHVLKVRLLFERGRAWATLGQVQRARADLAAAAALAGLLPPPRPVAHDIDYERAALEATERDRPAALEFARRALRSAAARELAADRMRFDPRFAALADDPAWQALLEP